MHLLRLQIFLSAIILSFGEIVINEELSETSVTKHNDVFYAISNTGKIFSSSDYLNWEQVAEAFPNGTRPTWGADIPINCELAFNDSHVLIYFASLQESKLDYSIGVAVATNIEGPFQILDSPLLSVLFTDISDPAVVEQDGSRYLVVYQDFAFRAYPLNADGISLSSTAGTDILEPELDWEGLTVHDPSFYYRNGYIYLVYATELCSNIATIGVARSKSPLGPYEKMSSPLVTPNILYSALNSGTIISGGTDALLFVASAERLSCAGELYAELIGWNEEDWPYLLNNTTKKE